MNLLRYIWKNLHLPKKIYTGTARGARDKYQVWALQIYNKNYFFWIFGFLDFWISSFFWISGHIFGNKRATGDPRVSKRPRSFCDCVFGIFLYLCVCICLCICLCVCIFVFLIFSNHHHHHHHHHHRLISLPLGQ